MIVKIRVDHVQVRNNAREYYALLVGKFGADNLADYLARGIHRSTYTSYRGFFGTSELKVISVKFDPFSYTRYEKIEGL